MSTAAVQSRWRSKTDKRRVEVYLPVDIAERLDVIAQAAGLSRAAVLTRLIASADFPVDNTASKTAVYSLPVAPADTDSNPPAPPAKTETTSKVISTGRRGKAKHKRLAEFESDRGLVEVQRRLRAQFDAEYTPTEVRDLVEPMFWRAMLKSEAEFCRARGQTDRDIITGWNRAGVPTLNGRGKWSQLKLGKL